MQHVAISQLFLCLLPAVSAWAGGSPPRCVQTAVHCSSLYVSTEHNPDTHQLWLIFLAKSFWQTKTKNKVKLSLCMFDSINHSVAIISWQVWQAALCHGNTWLPCQVLSERAHHTAKKLIQNERMYILDCVLYLHLSVPRYNCRTHRAFFLTPADSWNSDEQNLFLFFPVRSEATAMLSAAQPLLPISYLRLLSPRGWLSSLYSSFFLFVFLLCISDDGLPLDFFKMNVSRNNWGNCILTKASNKSW